MNTEDNGQSSRSSSRSSGSGRSSFSDLTVDITIEDGDSQEENSVGKAIKLDDDENQRKPQYIPNSMGKAKKLDDDENKRKPQYIPKKGTFYQHDDRANDAESKETEVSRRDPAKMAGAETGAAGAKKGDSKEQTKNAEKWTHDLYNEDDQQPKTTKELIATYGYDIRNEEAPPKARRPRIYSRGPNKYSRNWKDEESYTRAAPQRRVERGQGDRGAERGRSQGRGVKDSPPATFFSTACSFIPTMEFTPSRGRRPLPPAFSRERDHVTNEVDDSLKHAVEMLAEDFSLMYINNTNNIVEETIVPRSKRHSYRRDVDGGDGGRGRSKRYSTQRQCSLPEYSPRHNIQYYTLPQPPTGYVPTPVYDDVGAPQVPMMAFLPPGPPPAAPAVQPPQMSGQFEDPRAELYQEHSPESQSVVPRPNPPQREKLAIPIVPPPDNEQPQQDNGSEGKQDTPVAL